MKHIATAAALLSSVILYGAVDTGNLVAALEAKPGEARVYALISALEQTPKSSLSLVRCLSEDIDALYGDETSLPPEMLKRMINIWRSRPADLRCADLVLELSSRGEVSDKDIRQLTGATLMAADLNGINSDERDIFYGILEIFVTEVSDRNNIDQVTDLYDYLLKKYPRDPVIAHCAAEFWQKQCFFNFDTAPNLPGWEQLPLNNKWKTRLNALAANTSDLKIRDGEDAVAYSLLAVILHDRELVKKALAICEKVPVDESDTESAPAVLGMQMGMPELCKNVHVDLLPVYLAEAGDLAGAKAALADVSNEFQKDMQVAVMIYCGDFAGVREVFKQKKENLHLSALTVSSLCTAAVKLKDKEILDWVIKAVANADELPDEICNTIGYTCAEMQYQLPLGEKFIRQALENDPESMHYLDSMAWVLYRLGKFKEAREFMQKALKYREVDAGVAVLFLHAAAVELAATGDKDAARNYLQRAEKLYVPGAASDYDIELVRNLKEQLK